RDDQNVVLAAYRLDFVPIGFRRHDDAAGAHDGLADEGGHGFRSFAQDQGFEFVAHAGRKSPMGFAFFAFAIEMGTSDMLHLRHRQVEAAMVGRKAGEAGRGDRHAVVAPVSGDDLFLLTAAQGVVVVPDHLDDGVVGLGAGVGEERRTHAAVGQLHELLGKLDGRCVGLVAERVVEGQFLHLARGSVHQPLLVEADRHAPEAGHAFDVFAALVIVYVYAFAALDDAGPYLLVLDRVGVGMQVVVDVSVLYG